MAEQMRVGLIGGGVIGAGWAARFLLNGHDVCVYDPDPEIARKLSEVMANARRAWTRLYPGLLPAEGTLSIAKSLSDCVKGTDFIQENLPEREDLKRRIFKEIDALLPPDVVIGSSTSGILPTNLQADMAHPERLVVGHPFNPVYLLPLVEVCGGAKTSEAAKQRAAEIYTGIGMKVLHVRKEIDGFIADRLLEALWREALWLVNDGIATTEEVDDAIRYGAGLRWSFMGTFLVYRIAGGEAGMRHFMAQFGPCLKWPWTKLMDVPEFNDALVDLVSGQSDDQAAGTSIRDLERLRDDCLISVMGGLRSVDYAAGRVVKDHERRLFDRKAVEGTSRIARDPGLPLLLLDTEVQPEWIDYNGHMTEYRYLQCFGEASDELLRRIGVDAAYMAGGNSYYTVETHIMHRAELKLGTAIRVETQILSSDEKRLHVFHSLIRVSDGTIAATAEQMLLHVNSRASRACSAEGVVLERVKALTAAHRHLEKPKAVGRAISGAK